MTLKNKIKNIKIVLKFTVVSFNVFIAVNAVAQNQGSLTLDSVIKRSIETHPLIDAAKSEVSAAKSAKDSSGYLPAPMASFSWMGVNGPFENRAGNTSQPSWSVSQSLPFPTTWWNLRKAYSFKTQAAELGLAWRNSEISFKAKKAFWEYARAYHLQKLLDEEIAILKKHKRNTVLRPLRHELVKSHIMELEEDLALLENQISMQKAVSEKAFYKIAELTGESFESNKLPFPVMDRKIYKSVKSSFKAEGDSRYQKVQAMKLSQSAKVSESKSKFAPNFSLSFKSFSDDTPMPGGKELMVGITLPFVYFWQSSAKVDVEKAKLKILEAKERMLLRQLNSDWNSQKSIIKAKIESLNRLRKTIIPLSEKRFNYVSRLSATDMETLMQRYAAGKKVIRHKINELNTLVDLKIRKAWLATFESGKAKDTQQ